MELQEEGPEERKAENHKAARPEVCPSCGTCPEHSNVLCTEGGTEVRKPIGLFSWNFILK